MYPVIKTALFTAILFGSSLLYGQASVSITSPSGSEERKFGETIKISWVNGDVGASDYFYLYYSNDGGSFTNFKSAYIYNFTNSGDTSSFLWTIPDFANDLDSEFRIRVWNNTQNVSDTSESFRVYYEPAVSSISPQNTDERKFGEQINVSWTNGDIGSNDYFYLYYSKDGGAYTNFKTGYIYNFTNSNDTSSFVWTIPDFGNDPESEVKIRILNSTRGVADTTEAFRVYYEPSVNSMSPIPTDERKFGEQLTVSWVNGDIGSNDYYYLYYSKDGGAYTNFKTGYIYNFTNSGDTSSFIWTIPDFGTDAESEVKIRILNSTRGVADTTDAFRVYYEPSVTVNRPFPGENFLQGASQKISWTNGDIGSTDYYQFYYSVDGGAYTNFKNGYIYNFTNDGSTSSFNWSVPTTIESSNVKIRILNSTRNVADTSEFFTICSTCPAVVLYKPNGGEVLGLGKQTDIIWTVGTTWQGTDNIKIELSLDGGTTYESTAIFDGLYSDITDNTYNWTVSGSETTQGLIRITNVTQDVNDVSDAVFTIVSPPAAPTDFVPQENTDQTVTFTWTDNANNETSYIVEYSSDKTNWSSYSSTLAANSTSYTTTSVASNAYWWRVKASTQYFSSLSDEKYAGGYQPFGKALSFDGSDDIVTLPDSTAFDFGTGDFTIETWFKSTTTNTTQVLASNLNNTTNYFVFYISSGKLQVALSSGTADVTGSTSLVNDTWYHAAMVRSGDNLSIYLDGTQDGTTTGVSSKDVSSTKNITLGKQSSGSPYYLNGQIDEIRIWNVARSATDLLNNKDTVLTGTQQGLTAYYRLDHKSGTLAADISGNDFHGTWSGSSGTNTQAKWVTSTVGIVKNPTITLTYPNGGESLTKGESYNITWETQDINDSDLIEIRLSTDGGSNYSILADGNFGMYAGTYSWTPEAVAATAKIQIANTTQNVSDESDANFAVVAPASAIAVTYPNGGEILTTGKTYTIKWATSNTPGTDLIEIRLSTDGRQTYSILADGTFADYNGVYNWATTGTGSNKARIAVVNTTQSVSDESDANFTIQYAPTITVTAPNGSESYTIGQSYSITWTSNSIPDTDNIEIRLSTDGGQSYSILADGTFGTYSGKYSWTVSGSPTDNALIQVVSTTQNISDASDAVFSMVSAASITVVTPNGGETLNVGEAYDITWTTSGSLDTDNIEIRLSTDGGQTYSILNDGTFATYNGTYSWTVSNSIATTARIEVANTTQQVSDASDADFTIQAAPAITVLTPDGGEVLTIGETYDITWEAISIADTDIVELQLSTDGGGTYTMFAEGTFGDLAGTYTWTVPDNATSTARIQIVNTNTQLSDRSNGNFTIQQMPSVTVTSPNGGESWEVGSQQVISWDAVSFGSSDYIEIRLSADGGKTFAMLSEGGVYTNNQYALAVPDSVSDNVVVSVTNKTLGIADTSDAVFSIYKIDRSITITAPNGGEKIVQGDTYTVTFDAANLLDTDALTFALSVDGGATFPYTLSQGVYSSYINQSFDWTVTQPITDQALIKASVTNYAVADTSDMAFSIVEAPKAPVFANLSGTMVGDTYSTSFSLNEPATVYLVILENGNTQPDGTQIKSAALGESTLDGQVAINSFEYATADESVTASGAASFIRQQVYDIFLTAEDADGNLNTGVAVANLTDQFTPLEQDSIVVDVFYEVLDGANWTNVSDNWIELPLTEREEIVITNDRISALNFPDKSLSGSVPQQVTQLDSLSTLDLSNNKINGLPSMGNMPVLQTLNVSNNLLDFGDLETNSSIFSDATQYSPQVNLGEADSLTFRKGSEYTLSYNIGGNSNSYQWFVDRYNTFPVDFVEIADNNQNSIIITDLDFNNMGTYYLEVTNEMLPGLTISSEPVQVWATADLTIDVTDDKNQPLASGAAYALRNRGPKVAFDSIPKNESGKGDPNGLLFTNGQIVFKNLLLGEYLVAIRGDASKYLPTYYERTYLWEEADTLNFKDDLSQAMEMFVIPDPLTPADGSGEVSGSIESDFGDDTGGRTQGRKKVKRAACSMRRFVGSGRTTADSDQWELIAYVESDDDGKFQFDYIPPGTYRFNIEYPGIPMDPDSYVEFEIGEDGSPNSKVVLEAVITPDGIVVERINTLGFSREELGEINIYPNPATEHITLKVAENQIGYLLRLNSLSGQAVYQQNITNSTTKMEVSHLPNGIYFVNVVDPMNTKKMITLKVIIRH